MNSSHRAYLKKLYPLVEAYLVDIFRQSVNLVGARHGEIFSQDHKRRGYSVPFPACIRVKRGRRGNGATAEGVWSRQWVRFGASETEPRCSAPEASLQLHTPSLDAQLTTRCCVHGHRRGSVFSQFRARSQKRRNQEERVSAWINRELIHTNFLRNCWLNGRLGANPTTSRLIDVSTRRMQQWIRDDLVEVFQLKSRDRNCHHARHYTNHREGDVYPTNQATPRLASVIKEA